MISRNIITDILQILLLALLQIFVFNRINIAGQYTPVVYPVFVMFYPFYRNRYIFLVSAFVLGLAVDAFLGTWGINAFATTLIAYFRSLLFRNSVEYETDSFSFQSIQWSQFLFFMAISILIHQTVVQFLEFFKLNRIPEVLLNILMTSALSLIFIILYALIFKIKQKV